MGTLKRPAILQIAVVAVKKPLSEKEVFLFCVLEIARVELTLRWSRSLTVRRFLRNKKVASEVCFVAYSLATA